MSTYETVFDESVKVKGVHCDTRLCHHFESTSIVGDVSLTKLTVLTHKPEAPFTGCQEQQQNTTVTGPGELRLAWSVEADGLGKPNHHPNVAQRAYKKQG